MIITVPNSKSMNPTLKTHGKQFLRYYVSPIPKKLLINFLLTGPIY